jgi:predicted metal-dependent hydrolase
MNMALFEYRLRESSRASRVWLRVTIERGLEVVVPKGYDVAKVPRLVENKGKWIRAAFERMGSNRRCPEPQTEWRLPVEIALPAIDRVWHVDARETEEHRVSVRENGDGRLLILGAIQNEAVVCEALGRWLVRKTHECLAPRLHEIGQRIGFRCGRVYVKRQRTRWASCSRRRAVSLNAKLLFLPPELVEYVLIHELCHLQEPNHSWRFWSLVQHYIPEYRLLNRELRHAWDLVPHWAQNMRTGGSENQERS